MSGRARGSVGTWAEVQRAQQRQRELDARRRREHDRDGLAHQRRAAQEYKEYRKSEARRRTDELEAQVVTLEGLLAAGCSAPAFKASALMRAEEVEPFSPGPLAQPVRMPDPNAYQAQGGWTASRRAQAQAEARARFEHDWQTAQAAEEQRQQRLAAYQQQYDQWAQTQLGEIRRHNAGIAEATEGVRRRDPDAVVEHFSAALYASGAWPEGFPRRIAAAYDGPARQLVLDWELPGCGVVPEAKSVRYLPAQDQDKETPRPVGQRRSLCRQLIAQCMLLVLHQLFAADEFDALESVALNGFVDDHDPATGRRTDIFVSTVMASRSVFRDLHLEQVDAVSCLSDVLRGQLSARPDQLVAVRPGRRPHDIADRVVTHGTDEEPDLHELDPIAFESLVADLFRAMGMQAVTTQRSNDGGVDVDALDPTPIRGGKIVVQVKRYRSTVPPTAVRDLFGTVQDAGANKGVLVTTSRFGPGAHTFANGKPLELVSGGELVDLLHRHGLRGRVTAAAQDSPQQQVGSDLASLPTDYNVLGMSWSGDVGLDVCALVCSGTQVLSDEHFVFFNNSRTPDGSVCALSASPPDRAAIRVSFDALPTDADRLYLVAAVDPEVNPGADLSGFADAHIRLLDPGMAELGRLEVSDGRRGESALVLGSFRRRSSSDWDFVLGGKGYTGGLEQLVQDYGIEVE